MSKYIIAVFPSYEQAKKAIESVQNEELTHEITLLNKLPKISSDDSSYKLDGVISGVSDVFIGLPAFVNPMSAVDLPPQENNSVINEEKWAQFGFDKNQAMKYQEIMASGKTIVALKSDKDHHQLMNQLKNHGVEKTTIQSY